jgi:TonB family protein
MPVDREPIELSKRGEWRRAALLTAALQVLLWLFAGQWRLHLPEPIAEHPLTLLLDLQVGCSLRSPEAEEEPPREALAEAEAAAVAEEEDSGAEVERRVDPVAEPDAPPSAQEREVVTPRIRPLDPVSSVVATVALVAESDSVEKAAEPSARPWHTAARVPALPRAHTPPLVSGTRPVAGEEASREVQHADLPELPEVALPAESHLRGSNAAIQVEGPAAFRALKRQVVPDFPQAVRRSARVTLDFVVREDGSVGGIESEMRVDPRFEQAAIQALREWRFVPKPGREDRGTVTFIFALVKGDE